MELKPSKLVADIVIIGFVFIKIKEKYLYFRHYRLDDTLSTKTPYLSFIIKFKLYYQQN